MSISEKKFVLTYVVENVSSLNETRRYSSVVDHFNVPWKISCHHAGDNFNLHFHCDKFRTDDNWSITVNFDLIVISVKGKQVKKSLSFTFGSAAAYDGYGYSPFLNWEDLIKDYVVSDKMIIEAQATIEEMSGIEKPKKLRNFDTPKENFTNVVLKVGNEKFHVLKQSLAVLSPYFESLFFSRFEEKNQPEVTLKDIDPEMFQSFLELLHLYPSLTDSNVEGVLQLIDMYNVENGLRLCEQFLILDSKHSLRTQNRIAARYKLEKLKKFCFDNVKSLADLRSIAGPDLTQLDPSISDEIIEKSFSFAV